MMTKGRYRIVARLVSALTWEFFYRVAVLAVFVLGAWQRFVVPQVPQVTSDYGYLWPALSRLGGGDFSPVGGVNFLYPAWVYIMAKIAGDLRWVIVSQHLLGLAAGAIFFLIWRRLALFSRASRPLGGVHRALGLVGVAIYLLANRPIEMESWLRPDSLCVFWEMLCCWLALESLCHIQSFNRPRQALVYATIAGLNCVLLAALKPSFLLSAVLILAGLFFLVVRLRRSLFEKLACLSLIALFTLSIGGTQRYLTRNDDMSKLFFAQTLFSFHAALIEAQMRRDLDSSQPLPEERRWLSQAASDLQNKLAGSRTARRNPYTRLGFNPDYMVSATQLFWDWRRSLGQEAYVRYLRYWYWRSLRQQPLAFARKIALQIGAFYQSECPAFQTHQRLRMSYRISSAALNETTTVGLLSESEFGQKLVRDVRGLRDQSFVINEPGVVDWIIKNTARTFLLVMLTTSVGLILFARRGEITACWLIALFYALVFGNVLSISAVHSMEVPRYSHVLFLIAWLAHLWAIRCWIAFITAAPRGAGSRLHKTQSSLSNPVS